MSKGLLLLASFAMTFTSFLRAEEEQSTIIILTQPAATQVKKMIHDSNLDKEKAYLRVGAKRTSTTEYSYTIKITDDPRGVADLAFDSHGVPICIDPKSAVVLNGTTIDYREIDGKMGFFFSNPNAK